jgi:hypothetical protein
LNFGLKVVLVHECITEKLAIPSSIPGFLGWIQSDSQFLTQETLATLKNSRTAGKTTNIDVPGVSTAKVHRARDQKEGGIRAWILEAVFHR